MRLFNVPKPARDPIRGSKFKVEEQSAWKLRFLVLAVAADNGVWNSDYFTFREGEEKRGTRTFFLTQLMALI
jgi:hypothetical protein